MRIRCQLNRPLLKRLVLVPFHRNLRPPTYLTQQSKQKFVEKDRGRLTRIPELYELC